ncbi:ribonuclease H [Firmicutes bacterium CAG:552]|nr:ribonuclease H [Firmicutes bacterium CAG:552]
MFVGEWLNGRVAVSKTVGCVFESRLPCHSSVAQCSDAIFYHNNRGHFMKEVVIYTDGACSGNPGKGGYCAILMYNDTQKIISGYEESTTNNRMELMAIIQGLKALKERCKVLLHSDSGYCLNAFTQNWISSWQSNGWRTADKKPVKNQELWQELLSLTKYHEVTFIKVKGHSDNEYNNLCDQIARKEITDNTKSTN